jgi:hypothetical protein
MPLSEALAITRDYCTTKSGELTSFAIHSIELVRDWNEHLNPRQETTTESIWHYVITCSYDNALDKPYPTTLIILMNRNVYEPTLIPWDQRGRASDSNGTNVA